MAINGYHIGERIEVLGTEQGFENSYYAATIISRSLNYLGVRYETLSDGENEMPLEEFVSANNVRPYPADLDVEFHRGDIVDVWHNDGWWVGRYRRYDADREDDRCYRVYFDYMM